MTTRADRALAVLLAVTLAVFLYLIWFVFMKAPIAQPEAGGLAQKIFYFHAPAGYAMYLCGGACFIGSVGYLLRLSDGWNALSRAGADCAVVFGLMMITSGPLWAKKAWGVYWVWDPRLTSTLLTVLVYISIALLRAFSGDGEAERKFASALGVLGTILLPIIHYSVRLWGGNHPMVVTKGGGGLQHPDMKTALFIGFLAMTLLAIVLVWFRTRLLALSSRVDRLEERALADGLLEGS
jgi:heme exporter protein C